MECGVYVPVIGKQENQMLGHWLYPAPSGGCEINGTIQNIQISSQMLLYQAGGDEEPADPGPLDLPAFSRQKVERPISTELG